MGQGRSRLTGSGLSDKQLARTVVDGRRIVCRISDECSVTGYLVGSDAYHWLLASTDPRGSLDLRLVHKAGAAVVRLCPERTYPDEPYYHVLEPVVAPYRQYCERLLSRKGSLNDHPPQLQQPA